MDEGGRKLEAALHEWGLGPQGNMFLVSCIGSLSNQLVQKK